MECVSNAVPSPLLLQIAFTPVELSEASSSSASCVAWLLDIRWSENLEVPRMSCGASCGAASAGKAFAADSGRWSCGRRSE